VMICHCLTVCLHRHLWTTHRSCPLDLDAGTIGHLKKESACSKSYTH
jgi:hypothetical protein